MGLLDQLSDYTVAGPRPDHGLGRLRKYSFSPSSSAAPTTDVQPTVTRSISISRPPSLSPPSGESTSLPSSPASAPDSPFAAGSSSTPRVDGWRAFRRKSKMANVDVVREEATVGPRSSTVYDWIKVFSLSMHRCQSLSC
ncbi:dormancy-associated protein homolog 3-like isoform X1 [Triticum urartu]|uniref:dormancy-associated protein homolog 3-like isoform X1 n=1 Tax=Triticum urartu TaxID=4572 RepID=UPI0020449643|nr:dormancy-associated protein homolog 3-like isoform X1 [Triticum urartu]